MTIDPRIPTSAGTEHVGFSPTRQTSLFDSTKREAPLRCSASRMKGELHPTENRLWGRSFLHMDDSVEKTDLLSSVAASRNSNEVTM